jgi:putative addiction module component (TIGR02574 family)
MKTVDALAAEALELPVHDRLSLAQQILSSVEAPISPEIEAAWDAEIRERIRRYDAGEINAIPAHEVWRDIDLLLRK